MLGRIRCDKGRQARSGHISLVCWSLKRQGKQGRRRSTRSNLPTARCRPVGPATQLHNYERHSGHYVNNISERTGTIAWRQHTPMRRKAVYEQIDNLRPNDVSLYLYAAVGLHSCGQTGRLSCTSVV